ncbi:MAG TPA: ABC transporter ATP-binding protein [Pyrinomonadaceae bacterium]|nr:ABC transporter ATP-binding protein [Pyrinomonadaceae bacterium]
MSDSPQPGMVPIEDGAAPPNFPGGGPAPEGAESARPYPGGMMQIEAPKVKGWPYVRRSLKLLSNHKGIVTATMLLTLASNLAPFVIAAAFGPLVQILGEAAQGNRMGNVWGITGSLYSKANPSTTGFEGWLATPLSFTTIFVIWAGATVGVVLLRLVNTWMMAIFEQNLHAEVQERVYNHLQNLSLDFFTGGKTGALMQRILHETQNVQRVLTQVLLPPLVQAIALAIALLYMIGLSWQMTLISFAIAPLAFFLFRYALKKLERAANESMTTTRDLSGELNESLSGMADIQVFNAQPARSKRFSVAVRTATRATAKVFIWMQITNTNSEIYIALTSALVLGIGIAFGPRLGLGLAGVVAFWGLVPNTFTPIQGIISSYTAYQSMLPGIIATYELLDTRSSVVEKPNARKLPEVHGNVKFDNVVFSYTLGQPVLDGVSFDIKEGETIALVGSIGCGKSTIMNLILRFLDPDSGRVFVDGIDTTEVTLDSLRTQVSKLSQFPFFLKDTIRENVRLGKPDATDAEVEEACKLAQIHDVILKFRSPNPDGPKSYEMTVTDSFPSGGQKRLIALARCLIRQPEVLLLDEPTESLGAEDINRLVTVIRDYAKGANPRTCFVISHQLGFVASVADRIIVLDQGKLVDTGTHDELVAREGLYKTLYELKNVDPALLRTRPSEPEGAPPMMAGAMPA